MKHLITLVVESDLPTDTVALYFKEGLPPTPMRVVDVHITDPKEEANIRLALANVRSVEHLVDIDGEDLILLLESVERLLGPKE